MNEPVALTGRQPAVRGSSARSLQPPGRPRPALRKLRRHSAGSGRSNSCPSTLASRSSACARCPSRSRRCSTTARTLSGSGSACGPAPASVGQTPLDGASSCCSSSVVSTSSIKKALPSVRLMHEIHERARYRVDAESRAHELRSVLEGQPVDGNPIQAPLARQISDRGAQRRLLGAHRRRDTSPEGRQGQPRGRVQDARANRGWRCPPNADRRGAARQAPYRPVHECRPKPPRTVRAAHRRHD